MSSGAVSASGPEAARSPHPSSQPQQHAPATMSQVLGRDPKATPEMLVLLGALQTAGKVIASKARRLWLGCRPTPVHSTVCVWKGDYIVISDPLCR